MTSKEIYKELQKLLNLSIRGKIGPFHYNKRYKELMALLEEDK